MTGRGTIIVQRRLSMRAETINRDERRTLVSTTRTVYPGTMDNGTREPVVFFGARALGRRWGGDELIAPSGALALSRLEEALQMSSTSLQSLDLLRIIFIVFALFRNTCASGSSLTSIGSSVNLLGPILPSPLLLFSFGSIDEYHLRQ